MCHNSLSMAFNEDLLGPMSPGCLLECGAGRLAGRWKSAAPSPGGHVPLIVRCDRRSLAVKKLRIPALASAPAVSGYPKLCCRRLHRARRQFFFNMGQARMLPASVCGLWRQSALSNFSQQKTSSNSVICLSPGQKGGKQCARKEEPRSRDAHEEEGAKQIEAKHQIKAR